VKFREITSERTGEMSSQIRERVVAARKRQQERFKDRPKITCNARMGSRELKASCQIDEATLDLLKFAMADLNLSARAYDRILKVARDDCRPGRRGHHRGRPRFRGHPVPLARSADVDLR